VFTCQGIDDSALEHLAPFAPSLVTLRLRGCPVSSVGMRAIARLENLETLDLSKGRPVRRDPRSLTKWT
jgi:hypothetical protein